MSFSSYAAPVIRSGIHNSITDTIGETPLIRIRKLIPTEAILLAKMEGLNPLGSVKDRIGLAMIDAAEREGRLGPDGVVIESTSGNTGIALAMVCATRGYRCVLTMPDSMSIERRKVLQALGAELILTPAVEGMKGAIAAAERFLADTGVGFMPQQFNNPVNPEIHRRTTAEEIWTATEGRVDILISGVGTGGTITGVSEVLRSRRSGFQAIAVEPAQSPVISQAFAGEPLRPGPHMIQGIGAGFLPAVLDLSVIDEVLPVDQADAIAWGRRAAREEGLFVGLSSGAALKAASVVAARPGNAGKLIVIILPSNGERYLSSVLFSHLSDGTKA